MNSARLPEHRSHHQCRNQNTSDRPEDAVADLVDRIFRKYGEVDPLVDKAWHQEIGRRIADLESGKVQGIPLEETLAKARKITGQ
jgi:putative addiction module component (TIGR02574 family)